jgi:hypothetical protein
VPPTTLRRPATDSEDLKICPECGRPVAETKGSQRVEWPTVDSDQIDTEELVTHGWKCNRHTSRVVLPVIVTGPDARSFVDGWIGVRVEFADGSKHYIPVPEREVSGE